MKRMQYDSHLFNTTIENYGNTIYNSKVGIQIIQQVGEYFR